MIFPGRNLAKKETNLQLPGVMNIKKQTVLYSFRPVVSEVSFFLGNPACLEQGACVSQ